MNHGPKENWSWLLLATALSGFLFAAEGAAAAVPPASGQMAADRSVEKIIADAQTAAKNGNLRLALINLRNAVRIAPSSNAAHFQLGLVLYQTDDLAGAEREMRLAWKGGTPEKTVLPYLFQVMLARQEYQAILDQFPDPGASNTPTAPDILKARAFALQSQGRGPEALDASDRSLKLRRDGQGLLARAGLVLRQGDLASAGKFADEAMKLSPASIDIALFKLRVLRLTKDGAAAIALSDQLLAKFPDNLEVKFAHIEILLDQQQFPKAKTEVDAILAKQPGLYMAKYYKAFLMSQAGDARGAWDLALTLPKEFLQIAPGVGQKVSQIAADAGHPDIAADILGRVLGRDSKNLPARLRLAALYLDQANAASALNVLGPVKDSSDPEVMRLLARVYTRLDRTEDAAKVLKKLGTSSNSQEIRRNALANIQAGRTEQAIKDLKEAVAQEPGNAALAGSLIGVLVQARRLPEALAAADRLAADLSQRVAALIYRGDILLLQRNMPGAQAAFDKAVGLEPKNPAALLARANFWSATQKYDAAAKDLRAVLASDPKNVAARIRQADIAARQGKDQEVRKVLAEAIALSKDAPPRIALIRYLMARNDHQAALKTADDLVRLQPANADGVALRGQIQSALGQKQEAVASFRHLVSLTPNAAQSQMMLGNALFAADDRTGAQHALDEAAKISPDLSMVKAGQIDLQFALGNADAAVALARAFQASHPGSQADILLADTLTKAKRLDQAADVLAKSLAGKPDQVVLLRLVRVKNLANDKKAAANLMSQWLVRNPKDLGVRHVFAMLLMGERDDAGARVQYEAILKQDANDVLAMNNLGSLLQSGDPGRASVLFTKAVQLAPNSPDVNDSLGWLKVQQKDAAGGLSYLRRAHDLRPKDAAITYHLIVALDANSKRNEARALLKSLLASGTAFPEKQAALNLSSQWR
ncbi:MAG TPA: XrtA/PEP-CTERM system TPR-repeat protein PrsT [Rhizorhapis sp.]|nr:XrtA/PEP-CTERM system TPR-repeat protein PrsT [Rhizorhapis sp.]